MLKFECETIAYRDTGGMTVLVFSSMALFHWKRIDWDPRDKTGITLPCTLDLLILSPGGEVSTSSLADRVLRLRYRR